MELVNNSFTCAVALLGYYFRASGLPSLQLHTPQSSLRLKAMQPLKFLAVLRGLTTFSFPCYWFLTSILWRNYASVRKWRDARIAQAGKWSVHKRCGVSDVEESTDLQT